MLIDIPVTIAFDHDGRASAGRQTSRTFTMRFDTEDKDAPAQFTLSYPPADRCAWFTDRDGVLFGLFQMDTDRIIKARALAFGDSYAARHTPQNDNTSIDDVDRAVALVAAEMAG